MSESAAADGAPRKLCILSGDLAGSPALDELGSALGIAVEVLDAESLWKDPAAAVAEASALLVPWELDSRAGIEIVESLAQNPDTAALPVIMASESPTRAMVAAALSAGARSFVLCPYEADEVRSRLDELLG